MKTLKKLLVLGAIVLSGLVIFNNARAATLSQSNVSLAVGQSTTVYVSNVSNYVTISNSNSSIASISLTGNTINIYGIANGSTNATICDNGSNCNTLYINVSGNSTGGLSLSQTSVNLSIGQTSTVTAYSTYGSSYGSLYVSNNTNSSVVTTSISNNILSLYASSTGTATITVCQSYNTSCGTIYVTVGGYGYTGGGNSGLNISNLNLSTGTSITISSSNNNYNYQWAQSGQGLYVSNNSNPRVASAVNSSSNIISGCTGNSLYSITTGQLCNTNGSNTSYIPGCYGNSQYSITTGQPCFGSVNGSGAVTITGLTAGFDTITICQRGGNMCSTLDVTVSGGYAYPLTDTSTSGIPIIYSTSSAR